MTSNIDDIARRLYEESREVINDEYRALMEGPRLELDRAHMKFAAQTACMLERARAVGPMALVAAYRAIRGETDTLLTESPEDAAMARYKAALVTAAQDHTAVYNVWNPTYQAACDAAETTYKAEMADIARNKPHDA
jgi:hypothetical protein